MYNIKVLFTKENVCIYPSKDNSIPGDFHLLEERAEEKTNIYLAWTPKTLSENKETLEKEPPENLYTLQIGLKDILSIKRYMPTIGIPYIIIVSKKGVTFPPYYFHEGGVRELFYSLKDYASLVKSDSDPNLFFIYENTDSIGYLPQKEKKLNSQHSNSNMEDLPFNILEEFSKITQFTRNVAKGVKEIQINNILKNISKQKKNAIEAPRFGRREHTTSLGTFEVVEEGTCVNIAPVERTKEMSAEEFISFFDEKGRIKDEENFRKKIFQGGVDPSIRVEVWKYLLNYYPLNATAEEKEKILMNQRQRYTRWKNCWKFIEDDKGCHWTKFASRQSGIEKDVHRTDRKLSFFKEDNCENLKKLSDILTTYAFFNFDLGYVQGMNDLLAPILYVMENEADAFWCFKGLMDIMGPNFHKDQVGMHNQLKQFGNIIQIMDVGLYEHLKRMDCLNLFFCYRWLLINFKREFSFFSIQRIWEVIWSNYQTADFHLFIALAMLLKKRDQIISNRMDFDEILKILNDAAETHDVEQVLTEAEYLFHSFVILKKHSS